MSTFLLHFALLFWNHVCTEIQDILEFFIDYTLCSRYTPRYLILLTPNCNICGSKQQLRIFGILVAFLTVLRRLRVGSLHPVQVNVSMLNVMSLFSVLLSRDLLCFAEMRD